MNKICPFSEQRAEYQKEICDLSHDGSGSDYGENLAGGWDTSCPETVKLWTDEQSKYEDGRSPGFYMDTGHYTQVVWKSTTSFCCAIVKSDGCPDKYYTACNYYPPGNFDNEFEANVP
ncbi:PR-1 protein-like protein [Leptotrombidium deliense]|uniref:PR-1 protein-like protein n=1 Tax=Leptotrombidium deliense TaxID=299467 RepID=A0A443S8L0_9ACAR|nr:PR-1 protein-like protein [Leptotrombidium deliense]